MSTIPIRLQLTTRSNPPVYPVDINTIQTPQFWRGEDVQFDIGIFNGACVDLTGLTALQVAIFPARIPPKNMGTNYSYGPYTNLPYPNSAPVPLLWQTVLASSLTPVITWADWLAGTEQQASAIFPWTDTASLVLGGAEYADFWLSVVGVAGMRKLVYGGTPLRVFESGTQGVYLPTGIAPFDVPLNTTLFVQTNQQLPFSETISVEGTIEIEGQMIQTS